MKVASRGFAGLLADPSRVAGVLLYGPDQGLVRERSLQAARAVLGSDTTGFRLVVLPREDHSLLRDELASLSLTTGRRVFRVQDASDSLAGLLQTVGERMADLLVVAEAGSLTPRSKLRAMAESSRAWAAVSCYPEPVAVIAEEIGRILHGAGLRVSPDALDFLAEELGGDFGRRQSEVAKLISFANGVETVDYATARLCCLGQLEASLGSAVAAAFGGDVELVDRQLAELEREGASGPGLLAVLSMELHRILKVRAALDQGASVEDACRGLVPPVYPRQSAAFLAEVRRWPVARLQDLAEAVRAADLACKRAASRDFIVAARLLGSIAAVARSFIP